MGTAEQVCKFFMMTFDFSTLKKYFNIIVALRRHRLFLFSEVTRASPYRKKADGIQKTYFLLDSFLGNKAGNGFK